MKLENYMEIIGTLEDFKEKDRFIDLQFLIRKNIETPVGAISLDKLKELKGEKISIPCLDDHYYIKLF